MIPPRSLNEVMSVVGLFSYYRRFVKDFGTIAAPLYDLIVEKGGSKKTRKVGEINLEEYPLALQAFETLKMALISLPVLAFPVLGACFQDLYRRQLGRNGSDPSAN